MPGASQTGFNKDAVFRVALVTLWIIALTYPILSNRYLPFTDFPNHAARLHVLASSDSPVLASYYETDENFIGNSTMDLFVRVTNWHGDVYDLMRWSVVFYLVNFQLAALVLHRVLCGRFSTWPLVAGLAAYNAPLFWGFQNYLVAVPLAMYVLAAWIAASDLRPVFRILIMAAPIFLIYVLHSMAFIFLATAIGGLEIERFIRARDRPAWARAVSMLALTLPFWPAIIHLVWNQFLNETGRGSTYTEFGGIISRAAVVASVTTGSDVNIPHWIVTANSIAASILVLPAFLFVRRGLSLKLASGTVGMLTAVGLVTAFAPVWLAGVWAIHLRLGFTLFMLFVAATYWQEYSPGLRRLGLALMGLLLLVRVVSMESYLRDLAPDIKETFALFQLVEPGVAVTMLAPKQRIWDRAHITKYAVIERQAYLSTLFAGAHGFAVNTDQSTVAIDQITKSRCAPNLTSAGYYFRRNQGQIDDTSSRSYVFVARRGGLTLLEGCQKTQDLP